MNEYRLSVAKPKLWCLILLISFPSVAAVLLSPALPTMSDFFHVSNSHVQQIIILFMVGYAFGQLVYSPFANRYGRKPAIYIGLALYLLSCFLCVLAIHTHSIQMILWGRILMALGSSVGMIITFTIINDFYYPEQARPIVSYTVLAYAVMPAVAIFIGGFLTTHLSWQDCFYFLTAYGVFMFFVAFLLPETLENDQRQSLHLGLLLNSYLKAFTSLRLVLFSTIYGLMAAYVYIIASGAPFIGIDRIGLTPSNYGLIMLLPYSFQVFGAILSGKLNKVWSTYAVMRLGYVNIAVGSLVMLFCFLSGFVNVWSLVLPISIVMVGLPMVYSGTAVMAMVGYSDKATGSAIMTFITMLMALVSTLLLTFLPNSNPLMMPIVFVAVFVVAALVLWKAASLYTD